MTTVLDHGELELLAVLGNELTICDAARVSTGQDRLERLPTIIPHFPAIVYHAAKTKPDERDEGLIKYLLVNRHGTPFEHVVFQLRVKAPIFVTREWMRHRIGSFNERSGRYSTYDCEFYVPETLRRQAGKPGHYRYEDFDAKLNEVALREFHEVHEHALRVYEELLARGVAREQACRILPTTLYTEFYWTVNARALMNFLSLRNAPTAQWEIRQYALLIENELQAVLPVTHAAFLAADRTAP